MKCRSSFSLSSKGMYFTNISSHLLWYDSLGSRLTFIGPLFPLISSITCLVILNTYLKILHHIFKKLINIVLIVNIIFLSLTITINSYVLISQSQTFLLCSLRTVTNGILPYFTSFGIAMMSYLRYDISKRIVNCESYSKASCYTTTLLVLYGLFDCLSLGPLVSFSSVFFDVPTTSASCAGVNLGGKPYLVIFHFVKFVAILAIGTTYDCLMIQFLLKRKKRTQPQPGQAKLVPWKSGGSGDTIDFLVPVSATITSMILGIIGVIFFTMLMKGHNEDYLETWKYSSLSTNLISMIQMPVMIGLTIRAAKHKKPAPVLPKGPMFHEQSDDDDGHENEEHEMNDVNVDEQVQEVPSDDYDSSVVGHPNIIYVQPIIHDSEHHI